MQRLFNKQKRWLAVWLLWSCTVVSAFAYTPTTTMPSAWGEKPTLCRDIDPSYHFRTTSSMAPVVGATSYSTAVYSPVGASRPQKSGPEDPWSGLGGDGETPPTDDPIGQIPYTPVGEPMAVLLVLALGYMVWKRRQFSRPNHQ
jgi:hypothetical protein